jgi:hypothetical protein
VTSAPERAEGSRPVTPGTSSGNPYVEVIQAGIDDITLGFEMEGSRHIGDVMKLAEAGRPTRYGQVRLGHEESFGKFRDLVPRQYTTWSPQGRRVYVQANLAPEGVLTPLDELEQRVESLIERMALFGIVSYESPFVTRLDVTADGWFSDPAEGKAFLDSLLGTRLPGRMVARPYGVPMTTVYHQLSSGKVHARSYCRSTKTGEGVPFTVIRLERQKQWSPAERLLRTLTPAAVKQLWDDHYLSLVPDTGQVSVVDEEGMALRLARLVDEGEISVGAAERVFLFSKLDRLGLSRVIYPERRFAERRREARKLGLRLVEASLSPVVLDVGAVLRAFAADDAWRICSLAEAA